MAELEGCPRADRTKSGIGIGAMAIIVCWRCELPGHAAADCQRPPPTTRKELDARIQRHVERWDSGFGVISTTQKQKYIAMEIKAFEPPKKGKAK